jgi:adenylate kinase
MRDKGEEENMKVVLLGPPGAGKGTHAADLSKEFGIPHISTGDILRAAVKAQTEVGLQAKSCMDKGELVPDAVVVSIIRERLKEKDCTRGFLLDGFPRNIAQAQLLDDMLSGIGTAIEAAVYLETSNGVIIRRLSNRRVCKRCGATYNLITMPSKMPGICDVCGGELYQRTDDAEETVLNRLKVYQAQTADLIDYYKKKGILKVVNGDLERAEAYSTFWKIMAALKPTHT